MYSVHIILDVVRINENYLDDYCSFHLINLLFDIFQNFQNLFDFDFDFLDVIYKSK